MVCSLVTVWKVEILWLGVEWFSGLVAVKGPCKSVTIIGRFWLRWVTKSRRNRHRRWSRQEPILIGLFPVLSVVVGQLAIRKFMGNLCPKFTSPIAVQRSRRNGECNGELNFGRPEGLSRDYRIVDYSQALSRMCRFRTQVVPFESIGPGIFRLLRWGRSKSCRMMQSGH